MRLLGVGSDYRSESALGIRRSQTTARWSEKRVRRATVSRHRKASLTQIHTETPDKTIVIKADKRLKYREVRKVMEMINDAGFSRVGVVTEKRSK